MSKHYEQWTFPEIIDFARLKAANIVKILNESGFLDEFKLNNLEFKHFIVIEDHIQAVYTADIPGDAGDDWNNCDIFVWKHDGKWIAEFGGTPNRLAGVNV